METRPKKKKRRIFLFVLMGFCGLCLLCSTAGLLSNRSLPQADTADQLSRLDQARLAEALHLKAQLGNALWPGFGDAAIPIILSNDAYSFLMDFPLIPPAGWEAVMDDSFNSQPYYRQKADDPQNFAVQVGDSWAAGIGTKSATDVFLISQFRSMFPTPLKQVFPYRILIQPSETQIGGLLHENFHVLQTLSAPERLQAAEAAHRLGDRYEQVAADFSADWKKESALLADALEAESKNEKADLVRQFLATRDGRRKNKPLDAQLVDYERWLEWEEGTAKYIEVTILKAAFASPAYQPIPAMQTDPDFKCYQAFEQRWSQELIQLRYQTTSGESQFYMTGMAQAFLLDDLLPGWKGKYWEEDVFLEDLLREAVNP